MRISTMQQYSINVERMQNSQTTIGELQRQISTGKKYHQPSDAPAIAATAIRLERDVAALDRYDGNIKIATNRLELQEVMLQDMNTQIDRMREKVLSVDAAENDNNLEVIAEEIRQIVESLAGVMNKKDAQGEYIFSGSKGFTQPYTLNEDNRWEYQGDNGQRDIQVGATHYVGAGDSGQYLFETVPGDLLYTQTGADFVDLNSDVTFQHSSDKEHWEAYLEKEVNGDLEFKAIPTPGAAAGVYDIQLVDSSGTVHHTEPSVSLPADPAFTFEEADFKMAAPLDSEFTFSEVSSTLNGVKDVRITDNAAMDRYFQDYGDVELVVTPGTPSTYQLTSSKTGGFIMVDGEDSWPVPSSNIVSVAGMEVDLVTPIVAVAPPSTTNTFDLRAPGTTHTVTSTSNSTAVNMSSQSDFQAAVSTGRGIGPPAALGFEVRIEAGNQASVYHRLADGNPSAASIVGPVALTANPDGSFTLDDAAVVTATGMTFDFKSTVSQGETLRVDFDDSAGNSLIAAESTNRVDYEKKNILNIGLDIAEQLEKGRPTAEARDKLDELLDQAIEDITVAQDKLNVGVTAAGARLASLEETESSNLDVKLFTQTTLSGIQDADLAAVATEFKLEQTLLQASQQTFATVSRMTLFEYIR